MKSQFFLNDVDTDKMLVSNKVSCNEETYKYTIGYKDDDHKIKPSCIILWKTSAYVKCYDGKTK